MTDSSSLLGLSPEKIAALLDEVLVKPEDELRVRFVKADREDIFIETMSTCWYFLRDILSTGEGYLRVGDDSVLYLDASRVDIGGGGTLESTMYKHYSPSSGSEELLWYHVSRALVEPTDRLDYRLYMWLAAGEVSFQDFGNLKLLLWFILEKCVFEVIFTDDD